MERRTVVQVGDSRVLEEVAVEVQVGEELRTVVAEQVAVVEQLQVGYEVY